MISLAPSLMWPACSMYGVKVPVLPGGAAGVGRLLTFLMGQVSAFVNSGQLWSPPAIFGSPAVANVRVGQARRRL